VDSFVSRSLSIDSLVVELGSTVAVKGVSFAVSEPGVVAVVGGNGSGKTALLRAIVDPTVRAGGQVRFTVDARPSEPSSCVSAIVGSPSVIGWMSPISFARMLLESSGRADDGRVHYCFDEVGLDSNLRKRRLSRLSQGQRDLAAIGCALLFERAFLMLDEPMAHLDRARAEHLTRVLRSRAQNGTSVLFTAHAASDLAGVDRVLWLRDGLLVSDGPPGELDLQAMLR
jgi:ABC-type multidrug transport system ATPase subunit